MIAIGFSSFLAQILLTVSLQVEEAGKVSLMRKAGDVLFAFLFQITIFNVSSKVMKEEDQVSFFAGDSRAVECGWCCYCYLYCSCI